MAELRLSTAIYQLRLVLAGISPIIWRRLLVSSQTTIAQLHQYIQVAFDWSGEHLHRFRIHGKDYGIAYLGGMSFDDDPHQVRLSRFRLHPRESFRYEYDFTAHWRVDIRLEEILPQDQRVLPVCVGGRAAAPGEEYAGGALEYLRWLDAGGGRPALGDLQELRQAAERVWEYQEFQPRRCDRREIHRKLQAIGQEVVA